MSADSKWTYPKCVPGSRGQKPFRPAGKRAAGQRDSRGDGVGKELKLIKLRTVTDPKTGTHQDQNIRSAAKAAGLRKTKAKKVLSIQKPQVPRSWDLQPGRRARLVMISVA